jgi:hypothetical protein
MLTAPNETGQTEFVSKARSSAGVTVVSNKAMLLHATVRRGISPGLEAKQAVRADMGKVE